MTTALLVLSDEDYTALAELLQTQSGFPFTLNLSDGTFLSFGEHFSDTIGVSEGKEAIEVSGAKMLTFSGTVRIISVPEEPKK